MKVAFIGGPMNGKTTSLNDETVKRDSGYELTQLRIKPDVFAFVYGRRTDRANVELIDNYLRGLK